MPSHSRVRTWARLARGSLFMPCIYELICLPTSVLFSLIEFAETLLGLIGYRPFRFNGPLTSGVLTYMSIRDEIRDRARETPPRLFFLPPLIASVAMVREIFVSEEIMEAVQPPWPATEEGRRLAQMRAYLDG